MYLQPGGIFALIEIKSSFRISRERAGRLRYNLGIGLDPDIMLANATYQLDLVTTAWAKDTKRSPAALRAEITSLLNQQALAPFGGPVGDPLVNVLKVNLELQRMPGTPA